VRVGGEREGRTARGVTHTHIRHNDHLHDVPLVQPLGRRGHEALVRKHRGPNGQDINAGDSVGPVDSLQQLVEVEAVEQGLGPACWCFGLFGLGVVG